MTRNKTKLNEQGSYGMKRRCSECIAEHGQHNDSPIMHGHIISKGGPATFRCVTCGRKAYWNSGDRVPSLWHWFCRKLPIVQTNSGNGGESNE